MADPLELVQVSAFDAARLNAIDAYAGLESTLASILGPLLGSPENARTIFFRITNTRSRYSIIESLIKKQCEPEVRKFWANFERELGKIDQTRNSIIHWSPSPGIQSVLGKEQIFLALRPGHSVLEETSAKLTMSDLESFTVKARGANMMAMALWLYLNGFATAEQREALRKIFPLPINDQTPVALLQCLTPSGPPSPPIPFPQLKK